MSNESSDSEDSSLHLSHSSSSFDEQDDRPEDDEPDIGPIGNLPYQFEPLAEEPDDVGLQPGQPAGADGALVEEDIDRINDLQWCSCGRCMLMPTLPESRCCRENDKVNERREEAGANCITEHDGFEHICLNEHVLRVAYFQYRQQYGPRQGHEINEQYRYTAYRQFVRWCWGFLGRQVRVPLPSCAVRQIRDKFASEENVGFQYPPLH